MESSERGANPNRKSLNTERSTRVIKELSCAWDFPNFSPFAPERGDKTDGGGSSEHHESMRQGEDRPAARVHLLGRDPRRPGTPEARLLRRRLERHGLRARQEDDRMGR